MVGDGGYPTVDFSLGECTFCADCVNSCQPKALVRNMPEQPAWPYKAAIGEDCLPKQEVEAEGSNSAMLFLAIAIPLIIVIVAGMVYTAYGKGTQYQEYYDKA